MLNQEIYLKDPLENRLANNGVAEVKDDTSPQALSTLHYELESFVCNGEYEKGLDKILSTFLRHLDAGDEQPGVWISGFYGSGKSHMAKMLRALWTDFSFDDGTTARAIAKLPQEVADHFRELSNQGRRHGGLHAASGTLGAGANDKVRLALLGILFKSAGLPEQYHLARFVMWLKAHGYLQRVQQAVEIAGKDWMRELRNLTMSPHIAKALLDCQPDLAADEHGVRQLLRDEYKRVEDVSNDEMVDAITEALTHDGHFPLTLIVLDEVQQYIGNDGGKTYQVQEMVETSCKHFEGKMLFVATGQNALTGVPSLQRLMGRFQVPVQLSDTDVESVIRQIILQKKASAKSAVEQVLQDHLGEISRHLRGSKIEYHQDDESYMAADYPILPVRRRFWEKVLRIVDTTGTVSQLRNQLRVIHDAAQVTASQPLGHVVSGDFIYQQIAPNLLQTGVISKEIYERIGSLADGDEDQQLQSRLLALIFLIGKLPTESVADIGVRATADMLADLLVEDLNQGSDALRARTPELLETLAHDGSIMAMDTAAGTEYRLQTQESSQWHETYRSQEAELVGNQQRLEHEREDLLQAYVRTQAATVRLSQGKSNQPRKINLIFDAELAKDSNEQIYAWVQDGWQSDEKSVIDDARSASPELPTLYLFIPARNRSELSKVIATQKAADSTLQIRGIPTTPEGKDARIAMETRKRDAEKHRETLFKEIFNGVRVFQAGGHEIEGVSLAEKLEHGAKDSCVRLYRQFDMADHAQWGKVYDRARRDGGQNALEAIGYKGDIEQHPVCRDVVNYIGAGKKGSEIRSRFLEAPYGWPQDAIDGALFALLATGAIRATDASHKGVDAKSLERSKITQTNFKVENITIKPVQRIGVRKLLTEFVGCEPGQEEIKVMEFLLLVRSLAEKAGGDGPKPERPSIALFDEVSAEVGNAQLLKLYDTQDEIRERLKAWQATVDKIEQRMDGWRNLDCLIDVCKDLAFEGALKKEAHVIQTERRLLDDPDPVNVLVTDTTEKLRKAILCRHQSYSDAFAEQMEMLIKDKHWPQLTGEQRSELLNKRKLELPSAITVSTTEDIIERLSECSIGQWNDRESALASKFDSVRQEAAELLQPKIQRVVLPRATFETEAEIDVWLHETEQTLKTKLKDGPVML